MITDKTTLTTLALIAVLCTACTSNPTIDTSSGAERSFDGLLPVKGARVDDAWAREDLDVSSYNKIMLQGAGIHYRPVKKSSSYRASGGSNGGFPISEDKKKEVQEVLREAFLKELQKSTRFAFVTKPGPDVLTIRGGLLDVVSYVPPERIGRTDIYLSAVGEATLLLEMIDSESGAVLIRSVDRRAAESMGMAVESNSVSNRSEVRRLAQSWGRLLRDRLEYLADEFNVGKTQ
jgi:hypothetical protein